MGIFQGTTRGLRGAMNVTTSAVLWSSQQLWNLGITGIAASTYQHLQLSWTMAHAAAWHPFIQPGQFSTIINSCQHTFVLLINPISFNSHISYLINTGIPFSLKSVIQTTYYCIYKSLVCRSMQRCTWKFRENWSDAINVAIFLQNVGGWQ